MQQHLYPPQPPRRPVPSTNIECLLLHIPPELDTTSPDLDPFSVFDPVLPSSFPPSTEDSEDINSNGNTRAPTDDSHLLFAQPSIANSGIRFVHDANMLNHLWDTHALPILALNSDQAFIRRWLELEQSLETSIRSFNATTESHHVQAIHTNYLTLIKEFVTHPGNFKPGEHAFLRNQKEHVNWVPSPDPEHGGSGQGDIALARSTSESVIVYISIEIKKLQFMSTFMLRMLESLSKPIGPTGQRGFVLRHVVEEITRRSKWWVEQEPALQTYILNVLVQVAEQFHAHRTRYVLLTNYHGGILFRLDAHDRVAVSDLMHRSSYRVAKLGLLPIMVALTVAEESELSGDPGLFLNPLQPAAVEPAHQPQQQFPPPGWNTGYGDGNPLPPPPSGRDGRNDGDGRGGDGGDPNTPRGGPARLWSRTGAGEATSEGRPEDRPGRQPGTHDQATCLSNNSQSTAYESGDHSVGTTRQHGPLSPGSTSSDRRLSNSLNSTASPNLRADGPEVCRVDIAGHTLTTDMLTAMTLKSLAPHIPSTAFSLDPGHGVPASADSYAGNTPPTTFAQLGQLPPSPPDDPTSHNDDSKPVADSIGARDRSERSACTAAIVDPVRSLDRASLSRMASVVSSPPPSPTYRLVFGAAATNPSSTLAGNEHPVEQTISRLIIKEKMGKGRVWTAYSAVMRLTSPTSIATTSPGAPAPETVSVSQSASSTLPPSATDINVIVKFASPHRKPSRHYGRRHPDETQSAYSTPEQVRQGCLFEARLYNLAASSSGADDLRTVLPRCYGFWKADRDGREVSGMRAADAANAMPEEIYVAVLEDVGQRLAKPLDFGWTGVAYVDKLAVLRAYDTLHARGIIHGDIAARHVRRASLTLSDVDEAGCADPPRSRPGVKPIVKLIDFEGACQVDIATPEGKKTVRQEREKVAGLVKLPVERWDELLVQAGDWV